MPTRFDVVSCRKVDFAKTWLRSERTSCRLALILELATWFAPGFRVAGFLAAFWGAIVLSLVNIALRLLVWPNSHCRGKFTGS